MNDMASEIQAEVTWRLLWRLLVFLMKGAEGWHDSFCSSRLLSILNVNIMPRAEAAILGLWGNNHYGKSKRMAEIFTHYDIIELLTNNRYQLLISLCKKNKLLFKTFNSDFRLLLQVHYYSYTVILSDFFLVSCEYFNTFSLKELIFAY